MTTRANAIPVPDGNATKYFSYKEAWVRIKRAQGSGFYLEAVTLEESIIADRLISFLVYVGDVEADTPPEKHSFGWLLRRWMELIPEPIPTEYFPDLRIAVDDWRKQRNKVVHGMVKSAPGTDHADVLNFLKEAELVAFQGCALARATCDWCRKRKRQFRKAMPDL